LPRPLPSPPPPPSTRLFRPLASPASHAIDDPEFKQSPPHCVQGTEGQRKIDETLFPRPLVFQNKPVDRNLAEAVRGHRQIIVEKDRKSTRLNSSHVEIA